jgi:hypothetical protein
LTAVSIIPSSDDACETVARTTPPRGYWTKETGKQVKQVIFGEADDVMCIVMTQSDYEMPNGEFAHFSPQISAGERRRRFARKSRSRNSPNRTAALQSFVWIKVFDQQ